MEPKRYSDCLWWNFTRLVRSIPVPFELCREWKTRLTFSCKLSRLRTANMTMRTFPIPLRCESWNFYSLVYCRGRKKCISCGEVESRIIWSKNRNILFVRSRIYLDEWKIPFEYGFRISVSLPTNSVSTLNCVPSVKGEPFETHRAIRAYFLFNFNPLLSCSAYCGSRAFYVARIRTDAPSEAVNFWNEHLSRSVA